MMKDKEQDATADTLRGIASALRPWMEDMDRQREDWGYPHGVEVNARDALQGVYRMSTSVVKGFEIIADMLGATEPKDPSHGQ